ncbi:MAG TPA: translation initiation factor IF-2, partial [Aquihabitans sp.]|nr:translation initiation factor IF-2 [Aquihabitans sp.]
MAAKIRVHELGKELGLTNKETLDLCVALGIAVKTHSSSIEDAQADRVRRKAEREGLIRDEQPEEPKPEKKAAKKAPAKKAAAPAAEAKAPEAAAPEAPAGEEPPAPEAAEPEAPAAPPTPPPAAPAAPGVVRSSGSAAPPRPPARREEAPAPAPRPATPPPAPAARPASPPPPPASPQAPAASGDAAAAARSAKPPLSASGKPIPPPPPPRSLSGKPIPPPPGMGGRSRPPAGPGGPGRPGGMPSRTGGGARPPMGGPRSSVPGAGVAPGGGRPGGGPGGGPGGRPGGPAGRRPPRRKGRRRRNREELQPMDLPSYTPDNSPVPEGVTVVERASTPQDLGPKLNRTAADVVRFLLQQGEMVTATQSLSDDMIELFAAEIGAEIRLVDPGEEQEVELQKVLGVDELDDDEDDEGAEWRAPVITVMGHVDHGKTKLLDRIRDANVVAGEAGGITQHIGAYQVVKDGKAITFIDTPGHEAFTAMRARGADATDIVVLVVAADDGVMPQTIEAIDHARAADVPIVVAVNKIDRENADPDRVLAQLAERDLVPEDWGGETIVCQISALQGIGIDELLENLLVVAELEDLRANPDGRAKGVVLEAKLDAGRGPVATVLVQRGTLKVGDPLVAGPAWGRVRALINDKGEQVKEAGPSTPVQVLGLSDVATAGDDFVVAKDERSAAKVSEQREHYQRVAGLTGSASVVHGGAKLEDIFSQIQAGEVATLNLIVKADVTGSLEAVVSSLRKLERDDVKLSFVRQGVGGILKSDIELAVASNATIIGFNVRPDRQIRELAQTEDVEIRTYEVIYHLLEDIEAAMVGMLAPEFEEVVTGEAEVREIFSVPRVGKIAGCYVTNGQITRGSKVRFLREGTIIWKGAISSLRRFKDDVREVNQGF